MTSNLPQPSPNLDQVLRQPYIIRLQPNRIIVFIGLLVGILFVALSLSILRHHLVGAVFSLIIFGFIGFFAIRTLFWPKPRYVISPTGIHYFSMYRESSNLFIEWQNIRHARNFTIQNNQVITFKLTTPTLPDNLMRRLDKKFGAGDFTMAISGLNYRAKILLPLINTLLTTPAEQRRFVIQAFLDRH